MYKIAVNAGHCPGADPGACGAYSTEADIVKKVAEIVCSDLEKVGYKTRFIQMDSLGGICNEANQWGADLFVSIHCNSAASQSAKGTETFHWNGSVDGQTLARCVQRQLINTLGTTDRGLKTANFAVLRGTDMPACLTELAFISNTEEEALLNNNIEKIAHAVARGITDYYL